MEKKLPIGVFDSGVGGLTVFKELRRVLPAENLIYFGDTGRTPYGCRTEQQIREFVDEILNFMSYHQVKLAVAACNTITVLGLDSIRKNHKFPLIGVSQGARLALAASNNKHIGVIATEATIRSGKHVAVISAADAQTKIFPQACPKFAPMVEAEKFEGLEIEQAALEYLAPLQKSGVDTLILACTHYPFLTPVIEKIMGQNVTIIDPARETALEAQAMLKSMDLLNSGEHGYNKLYFSADVDRAKRIAARAIDVSNSEFGLVDLANY